MTKTIDRVVRLVYRILAGAVAAAGVVSIEQPKARWVAVALVAVAISVAVFDFLLDLAHDHGQLTDVPDVVRPPLAVPAAVDRGLQEARAVAGAVSSAEAAAAAAPEVSAPPAAEAAEPPVTITA